MPSGTKKRQPKLGEEKRSIEGSVDSLVSSYLAVNKLQDLADGDYTSPFLPLSPQVLRTCPPTAIQQATLAFDSLIRETLSDLAGGPLSDWAWKKASLPSSFGGLNLRSASLAGIEDHRQEPKVFSVCQVRHSGFLWRSLCMHPSFLYPNKQPKIKTHTHNKKQKYVKL